MSEPEKESMATAPVFACFVLPDKDGKVRVVIKAQGFAVARTEDGPEGVVVQLGEPLAGADYHYVKVLPED